MAGLVVAVQNNEKLRDIDIAAVYNDFVSGNRSKESLKPLYLNDSTERSFVKALENDPRLWRTQVCRFGGLSKKRACSAAGRTCGTFTAAKFTLHR